MNDAVATVVWLAANLLLVSSGWLWSRRLFPRDGLRQTTIHVLALCWACVVVNTLALGALGILSATLLLASVSASCLVGLAVLWATGERRRRGAEGAGGHARPVTNMPLEGASPATGGPFGNADLLRRSARRERWWAVAWGLLGAFLIAHVVFDGLLVLPTDWDSLAYHVPLIDHWLRERTLYVPDCAYWYCAGNNEVLGLWFVGPFSGDYLIALNNLPAAILLAAAAVELAMRCGVSRGLSHLAGMAIVATRPMMRQLVSAENDVAVAALFLAALVYAVRYARHRKPADLILASLTFGLLTGVKYYALGYAGVAGIGVVALLIACRRPRDALWAVAVGTAGVLILGAYWYLRNTYATGAPLYPLGLTESTNAWAEMRPGSHTSTLLASGRAEVWPLVVQAVAAMAGPCQLAAILLLPVTLSWLAVSAWMIRNRAPSASRLRGWLLLVIALSGLVFIVTPNVVETAPGWMNMVKLPYHPVRFGLCFLCVSTLGVAVILDDIVQALRAGGRASRPLEYGIYGLWSVAVGYQLAYHVYRSGGHFTLGLAGLTLTLFWGGVFLFEFRAWASTHRRLVGCVVLLCAFPVSVWCCQGLADHWHDRFAPHFDRHFRVEVFESLARLDPHGQRIGVCEYRYYPFLGSRREFDVCRPLWLRDYSHFLQWLQREEVSLLVTATDDPNPMARYAHVKQWIIAHPELFQPLHEDYRYTIVRVDRARLRTASGSSEP